MIAALVPAIANAEPGVGPRENINQEFTATQPGAATGLFWEGRYHATGENNAPPPAMPRMRFGMPDGFRFDTSVPAQCKATDAELSLRGPAARPPESILGDGTAEGLFLYPFAHDQVFDHFVHHVVVINNANEQILLVHSGGWTVQRGKMLPATPTGACADDSS